MDSKLDSQVYRSLVGENFEKTASLGVAGAFHVVPNIATKLVRGTQTGKSFLADMLRSGYSHGLEGKTMDHTKRRLLMTVGGPEYLAEYEMGKQLGKIAKNPDILKNADPKTAKIFKDQLNVLKTTAPELTPTIEKAEKTLVKVKGDVKGLDPKKIKEQIPKEVRKDLEGVPPELYPQKMHQAKSYLDNLMENPKIQQLMESDPALFQATQNLSDVVEKAVMGSSVGKTMSLAAERSVKKPESFVTKMVGKGVPERPNVPIKDVLRSPKQLADVVGRPENFAQAGVIAGSYALNPHAALHPIFNLAREGISKTPFGKRFLQKGFERGLSGKAPRFGNTLGTLPAELAISPGAAEPYHIGKHLRRSLLEGQPAYQKFKEMGIASARKKPMKELERQNPQAAQRLSQIFG